MSNTKQTPKAKLWAAVLAIWAVCRAVPHIRETYRFRRHIDKAEGIEEIQVFPVEDWKENVKRVKEGKEPYDARFIIWQKTGEATDSGNWYLTDYADSYDGGINGTGSYSEKEYGPFVYPDEAIIKTFLSWHIDGFKESQWERRFYADEIRRFKGEVKAMD